MGCTELSALNACLQGRAAMTPKGSSLVLCVLPGRLYKERANQTEDADAQGGLYPREKMALYTPRKTLALLSENSCPPWLPTLSKRSKDRVLLCNPPSRTLSISVVQEVARPAGLDSPAAVNTRET